MGGDQAQFRHCPEIFPFINMTPPLTITIPAGQFGLWGLVGSGGWINGTNAKLSPARIELD